MSAATRIVARLGASLPLTLVTVFGVAALAVALANRVFGVTLAGSMALYFMTWWILLFAVLPIGVASRAEEPETAPVAGSDPGAPASPRLGEKAVWTTLVATATFIGIVLSLPLIGL